MCAVEAELDAIFPAEGHGLDGDTWPSRHLGGDLPRIPGYDVESLLGRGGMGVVYKARHRRLNRPVALKMLLAGAYAGPPERARFQREAEAVASLHHANIVAVYDVGDHDGCPYFTMELLEGGSLAQALAGTPQPARPAAALLSTLAEAMQAAHRAGIVHRDLKPANILLTADGSPRVADFGLARPLAGASTLTLSGARIGTPSYMAPEQVTGKVGTIGPATDVYALGAVLYEMLTGRPPFRGETAAETERQVIHDEPVSPSRLNTKVPRDLETICLKCLEKEPQRRYAGAVELADDLRRFGEGRPIQARPVGWAARSWRWSRRNPTAAALLVTGLALVGLASGGGVWLVQQRAERRAEAARHYLDLLNGVGTALAQAVSLRQQYHFRESRELLEFATKRLDQAAGPDDLRRRVDQARADVILAQRLDDARARAATLVTADGLSDPAAAEPLYLSAFADAGLGREGDDIQAVVAAVRASAVRTELIAALDDWASMTRDLPRLEWLLAVARGADPDGDRDRLRQSELWLNPTRLTRVASELRVAELSPQLATTVGRVSRTGGGEAVALLAATQRRFPQDFWVTFELALVLNQERRWDEALGYSRAALALRPDCSAAYIALGEILHSMGRVDEAIDPLERAVRLDPGNPMAHTNLARALDSKGLWEGAIEHYRQALNIAPGSPVLHNDYALLLESHGQLDEAIEHLRLSVSSEPNSAHIHLNLSVALYYKGLVEEGFAHAQQSVRLDPNLAAAHLSLAHRLRDSGRPAEAIEHLERAARLENPKPTTAWYWLVLTRYQAACAYVQAAAGRRPEDARRGESEHAGERRQALEWLRANLELTARLRNDGKELTLSLSTWRSEPALASVRDPAALAKLPEAEREMWQHLWTDVAASIAADPLEQARSAPLAGNGIGRSMAMRGIWPAVRRIAATSGSSTPLCHSSRVTARPTPGLAPHDRAVRQGGGPAVLPHGPRLHPGPRCRRRCVAARPHRGEGTQGLRPGTLVTDRARGPGVPRRPVPAGGPPLRAEPPGRSQAGRCGGQLALAGPGRATPREDRRGSPLAEQGPGVARSVPRGDAGPCRRGVRAASAQLAGIARTAPRGRSADSVGGFAKDYEKPGKRRAPGNEPRPYLDAGALTPERTYSR